LSLCAAASVNFFEKKEKRKKKLERPREKFFELALAGITEIMFFFFSGFRLAYFPLLLLSAC
jgi:hypothetical protein